MNIFDRFLGKSPLPISDHHCQLIALTCYNLAKKLRTNTSITNENEQTSWIFFMENYTEDEIFVSRRTSWFWTSHFSSRSIRFRMPNKRSSKPWIGIYPLSFPMITFHYWLKRFYRWIMIEEKCVYMFTFFSRWPSVVGSIHRLVVNSHTLLFHLELNTLSILPSLLACACLKATIKGLCLLSSPQLDQTICELIDCHPKDLLHTQRLVEQLFQSCLQEILPTPARRCLAPIQTGNVRTSTSPRVK